MRAHFWRRAAGWMAGGLLAVAVAAAGVVFLGSEYLLRRHHEAPLEAVRVPVDAAALEQGRLRARLVGCYKGCHGPEAEGTVWVDEPGIARLTTPNLTQVIPQYTDAELVRLLRYGVRRDGTTAIGMPSHMFFHLSESDLGAVIAFMRSLPAREGPKQERHFGWKGRLGLLAGEFPTSVAEVDRSRQRVGAQPATTSTERGRYIAMITCPECHGPDLEGYPGDTPPLLIVAAYSFEEFTTLMRTGVAKGGRDVGLMSYIGRGRTTTLTDQEVADLYAFLQSRLTTGPGPR
ncbi:MAG: cytochrome c [Steroidobacteraceae bacterium]|nr:cytochrome c [Steroidobacteraceae bacterium]